MPLISPAALLVDEVARFGSIRRAAERLNASASAVNRQILNLEAELGAPLFERMPRGVRLTAAGEVVVDDVRRWRRELERATGRIRELKGLQRGHVAIGVMECFVAGVLPRTIGALQRRHPGVTVEVFIGGTEQILERLAAQTIDVALCFNPPTRPHVTAMLKLSARPGLVASCDHPVAQKKSIRLSDCARYSFVMPDRSLGLRRVADDALRRAGIEPLAVVATNSTSLIKALISEGGHLAILSYMDVLAEVEAGRLSFVSIEDIRLPAEELLLCVAPNHTLSSQAGLMIEILRQELRALPPIA
ncbi:LysR family transcriptional regulator [Methylocapsa sp. S129]|uniref:LysR family transcriptional regulator n=1 Tax=Methylocapsa sp. S129 TaxID=1641869 RepID=UPI00131A8B0E|nr:LysR family transcriptional regulator [Methylocapsa sp. S129]